MLQFRFVPFLIYLHLLVFQPSTIECRPRTQRITVHGHEWTVPDEPGWEEFLQKVEPIRHRLLSNCATTRECRLAADQIRQIFLKHAVSANYYDDIAADDLSGSAGSSIFRWG